MAAPIRTTTDMAVFADGVELAGHASEVEFEAIEFVKSEETRLGLFGTPKVSMAMPPVIVSVNWKSLMEEWANLTANPFEAYLWQFRGNITETDSTGRVQDLPLLIELSGISDVHHMGASEAQEAAEYESSFNCTTFKQTIDGVVVVDYDLYAYTYVVAGTDLLVARRANLGI